MHGREHQFQGDRLRGLFHVDRRNTPYCLAIRRSRLGLEQALHHDETNDGHIHTVVTTQSIGVARCTR
jgi:hypothetical protein